jgi:hypothetical protein
VSIFLNRIKLICPVQPPLQKYFCFTAPSRSTEGRAHVTDAERDAVDAVSAYLTNRADADGEVVWS